MEKQDKLNMHTSNIADANFSVLAKMFPNAVTETVDENGEVIRTRFLHNYIFAPNKQKHLNKHL